MTKRSAERSAAPSSGDVSRDNLRLLAYVHHMAQTARCDAAKRLFSHFAQQEARRLHAHGALPVPADGHVIAFPGPLPQQEREPPHQ